VLELVRKKENGMVWLKVSDKLIFCKPEINIKHIKAVI
jgi:hypothetical protein